MSDLQSHSLHVNWIHRYHLRAEKAEPQHWHPCHCVTNKGKPQIPWQYITQYVYTLRCFISASILVLAILVESSVYNSLVYSIGEFYNRYYKNSIFSPLSMQYCQNYINP